MVRPAIEATDLAGELGLHERYGCVTLHRPSNVDEDGPLSALVEALIAVQSKLPLIFPAHPRTAKRLTQIGADTRLIAAGVRLIERQSYIRFMSLITSAAVATTDSGGMQEETNYLGIPRLTLRDNTERPITVAEGTNRLVTAEALMAALDEALTPPRSAWAIPEYWDGQTAARCIEDLRRQSQ